MSNSRLSKTDRARAARLAVDCAGPGAEARVVLALAVMFERYVSRGAGYVEATMGILSGTSPRDRAPKNLKKWRRWNLYLISDYLGRETPTR